MKFGRRTWSAMASDIALVAARKIGRSSFRSRNVELLSMLKRPNELKIR
jgi:hypothetical protein